MPERKNKVKRDQMKLRRISGVVLCALAAIMVLASAAWQLCGSSVVVKPAIVSASGRRVDVEEIRLPEGTVDANTDDVYELTELVGIGESLAAAIICEREENGPYFYPEDLESVRGIGNAKVEKFRDYLDFSQEK